jgi:hypothetical protein
MHKYPNIGWHMYCHPIIGFSFLISPRLQGTKNDVVMSLFFVVQACAGTHKKVVVLVRITLSLEEVRVQYSTGTCRVLRVHREWIDMRGDPA